MHNRHTFSLSRLALFPLLFIILPFRSSSQTPFKLSNPGDPIISIAVIPLNFAGSNLYHSKEAMSEELINSLDPMNINSFDRSAVKHYSLASGKASDILMIASIATPAFLMIDKNINADGGVKAVMYFQTIGLTAAEIQIVKGLIHRPRPYTYNRDVPMSKKMKQDATCSFFSGHTSMTAATSFFAAGVLSNAYPENEAWYWSSAAVLPLLTGYFRYDAGQHFFSDILVGFVVGALNGYLVTKLH